VTTMDIGIGLPSTIPGVDGRTLLEFARRAETAGFSTLGTIDRLVYGNYEPLMALAGAAAVTERIGLTTAILIAPYRANTALLAKQVATLDQLSAGRLTLGIAVGVREDDYQASHVEFGRRGRMFDAQLDELQRLWSGKTVGAAGAVGPSPVRPGGPPLLFGGTSYAAIRRTVERGAGWIAGGGGPALFGSVAEKIRAGWHEAGREGEPWLAALAYFALGPDAGGDVRAYLDDYYGFLGDVTQSAAHSEDEVAALVGAFEAAGCDELIFFPSSTDVAQVDLLAAAAL
jgi:alkanesulfonate monooxygenase SsuD/methylene tetrahydromethanopterin reductase-like flavin-dependent oxidoreductase (luciferase family)